MNKNFNLMLFFFVLMFSIIIGINANSMLYFWISIEVNMISFIPLIMFNNKNKFNDSFMKYFLIQSISSSMMLFYSISLMMNKMNFMWFMILIMLMKLGMFPFYYWYINMLLNLSWINCFLLMSVQKILIFFMMSNLVMYEFYVNVYMLNLVIVMSALMSMMLLFKNKSLKILMGCSSLNQMSWMVFSIFMSVKVWIYYYSFYMIILMNLVLIFEMNKIESLKNLFMLSKKNKLLLFSVMMSMMSIPPMVSFYMKSFMLLYLLMDLMFMLGYLLIMSSVGFMYFYMKIFLTSMIFSSNVNYLNMKLMNYIHIKLVNLMVLMILLISGILVYWVIM
uniref:NADH-ubiquinone oxidoreductase chain 2 n=1 Tax=Ganaspini sp. ZJUH 20220007 TaxID=2943474 RepID=A0A9E8JZZ3_9HYME|nr:NADH dehydrogenase subunit 2 [Ganaspini sp. ZJUH 20220007]